MPTAAVRANGESASTDAASVATSTAAFHGAAGELNYFYNSALGVTTLQGDINGDMVADFAIDNPIVHVDLRQFTEEAKDDVPMKDRGWQDALQAIYPLKINRLTIHNGDLTYSDKGPFKPLRITRLDFIAENIRNVESAEGSYPSPVWAQGIVFDTGKIKIDGHADFLAEPHVTLKGGLQVEHLPA